MAPRTAEISPIPRQVNDNSYQKGSFGVIACATSPTRTRKKAPIGIGTSIGWIGCVPMAALLFMGDSRISRCNPNATPANGRGSCSLHAQGGVHAPNPGYSWPPALVAPDPRRHRVRLELPGAAPRG